MTCCAAAGEDARLVLRELRRFTRLVESELHGVPADEQPPQTAGAVRAAPTLPEGTAPPPPEAAVIDGCGLGRVATPDDGRRRWFTATCT